MEPPEIRSRLPRKWSIARFTACFSGVEILPQKLRLPHGEFVLCLRNHQLWCSSRTQRVCQAPASPPALRAYLLVLPRLAPSIGGDEAGRFVDLLRRARDRANKKRLAEGQYFVDQADVVPDSNPSAKIADPD